MARQTFQQERCMTQEVKSHSNRNGLSFFRGFLHHPGLVASIIPSSRFLERRLVEIGSVSKSRLVVELGPGTGGTTKAILNALPKTSTLLAIELHSEFIPLLQSLNDPRLVVHLGSAEHIEETLSLYGLDSPDLVISGIPFSTMPVELGQRIVSQVWACLAPGGSFVAYQFRDRVAHLGRSLIGEPNMGVELLNVPPVRVYSWRKNESLD